MSETPGETHEEWRLADMPLGTIKDGPSPGTLDTDPVRDREWAERLQRRKGGRLQRRTITTTPWEDC